MFVYRISIGIPQGPESLQLFDHILRLLMKIIYFILFCLGILWLERHVLTETLQRPKIMIYSFPSVAIYRVQKSSLNGRIRHHVEIMNKR